MNTNNNINNLYNQNVWNNASTPYVNAGKVAAVSKVAASNKENSAAAVSDDAKKPENDRVDFSADTKVINKMSDSERAALVNSLKADMENQMTRFTNMMTQIFQKQGITGLTAGSDNFWRTIASGNFTVDAETKANAQEAISEDGYWGVKQTSQRIFDFAAALAGDDVNKMRAMQDAVEKGFKAAEKSWGGPMPSITGDTHKAVSDLFNDYYEKAGKTAEEA